MPRPAAHGYLYQQLQRQVNLLSFMDCFRRDSVGDIRRRPVAVVDPAFQAGWKRRRRLIDDGGQPFRQTVWNRRM